MPGLLEAWVTSVVEEKDVAKALVLAKSLRRSFTSKRLVVLIPMSLKSNNRGLLETHFDQVMYLDHSCVNGWISMKDYGKLYSLNLTLFQKCVFLAPETIVLKNCDEIFDSIDGFHAVVRSGTTVDENEKFVDTSVFGFVPQTKTVEMLISAGKRNSKNGGKPFFTYLNDWLLNQKGFRKMDEKYNFELSTTSTTTNEFCIAKFPESITDNLIGTSDPFHIKGLLETAAFKYWRDLYDCEIGPLMTSDSLSQVTPNSSFDLASAAELENSIAIVGLSCRHAGSNNLDEFWDMLIKGHSGIRPVPSNRWTKEQGCPGNGIDKENYIDAGFLTNPMDEFDAKHFGISPKEMEFLDPQQRLLLEVTWEALENATIDPQSLNRSHAGVFLGAWMNDYKDLMFKQGCAEFYRLYMGNSFGAAAARLSFFLGLTGPSVATESGCSSAMVAVDLACKSLRRGEVPMALACGVNLLIRPFTKDSMPFIVSKDGKCKTFDESADGFGRAEGCGVLVLKMYRDAVKDGDTIHALIRGSSCVQEGVSRSMGTPTKECESLAMSLALKDAGVNPWEVSYVEAHGTGTSLGDPLEISAIAEVYGNVNKERSRCRGNENPLIVGSVKTNIGHTESCSGITGILKVIASLQNEVIPPHLNLTRLNPKIDLDAIPAKIPLEAVPWPRKVRGSPRIAGVSSFGITGTDGHLIIQEAPLEADFQRSKFRKPGNLELEPRPLHILKLSARTEEALASLVESYQRFLSGNPEVTFADICYSANTGRATFPHRAVVLAKDFLEASRILQNSSKFSKKEAPDTSPGKLCFLFTGQGSQYPGMARTLYQTSAVFRVNFDLCHKILLEKFDLDVKKAMWSKDDLRQGQELSRSLYSQTSIFCVEYCLLKLWESWGVKPDCVIGHSLGEFCAAVASGILSLEQGLTLVAERSRLVESLPKGKMLALRANFKTAQNLLEEFKSWTSLSGKSQNGQDFWLDIAAINSEDQTVFAGTSENIESFAKFCSSQKNSQTIKVHILDSTHAFHSRMMDPILESYGKVVAETLKTGNVHDSNKCEFISGVHGNVVNRSLLLSPKYWIDHTREKVDFIRASHAAMSFEAGCRHFLEIGPQPVLSALVMANIGAGANSIMCLPSLRKTEENWRTILESLGKLYMNGWNINWKGLDRFQECSRKKVPNLPTYPFQRKKYWFDDQTIGVSMATVNQGASLHPLLGSAFPNASGVKIFQNGIDIRSAKLDWVRDHCIGRRVIFPGAAFLEMCLSAGHCATEGITDQFCRPSGTLTLEGLKITAPLALDSNGHVCQLQVVIDNKTDGSGSHGDGDGTKIQVFRLLNQMEGEAPKWASHCQSHFTPAPTFSEDEATFRDRFNFFKLQAQCIEEVGVNDLYGKLANVGLNFGPIFQSLQKIFRGSEENGILAEVRIPGDWRDYILHPVITDAMLQAAMVVQIHLQGEGKGKIDQLQVPVEIKRFTWLQHPESKDDNQDLPKMVIYSCHDPGVKEMTSILFDATTGNILAFMSGMTFAETSVQQMEQLLDSQDTELPALHVETWKSTLGPYQCRADIASTLMEEVFNTDIHQLFEQSNLYDQKSLLREELFETLCFSYVLNAFHELGWSPQIGDIFHLDKFIIDFQVVTNHRKLVRYHMTMLERAGILRFREEDSDEIEVLKVPPSIDEIQETIESTMRKLEGYEKAQNSIEIYKQCGSRLALLLQGKESALPILFPQDPGKPSAETFYSEAYAYSGMEEKTKNNFRQLFRPIDANEEKGILRILEVGAGTGNFTRGNLAMFREQNYDIEYTFTDISPSFFISAQKKFEDFRSSIKFRILNVEEDAKSQGFSPGYFDIIFGADVIHATKNITESILNLRQLLKPKGLLCLIEGAKQNHITCIFGLLDGYWRFVDTDIRKHHPLVNGETWRKICLQSGFDRALNITCSKDFYTFVLARASDDYTDLRQNVPKGITFSSTGRWIIFGNTDKISKILIEKLSQYRHTITVWRSTSFHSNDDCTYFGVNINHKEQMTKLFSKVKGHHPGGYIEGIVYLWGMTSGLNTGGDQAEVSQPFLHLCQSVAELKQVQVPKFVMTTRGVYPIGDHLCGNPGSSTLWGIGKSCANEMNMRIKMIDFDPRCETEDDTNLETEIAQELFFELWNDNPDLCMAYRQSSRYFARLNKTKFTEKSLKLPVSTDRFHLILPQSRAIADLRFGPLPRSGSSGGNLKPLEVEVQVKAAALNFRDVFAVLKPSAQFESLNVIGSDFAGIVTSIGSDVTKWSIGDPVFGCNLQDGALPSHVRIPEDCVVYKPMSMTFAEASTLPAVFATAYYSLVTIAKIKRGDIVLLHTASGGVGLSAIQICQQVGAHIIATAGSTRKRQFLRNLGIPHVYHSRNTHYQEEILKVTGGHGVNIVLNSLTGPGFKEASLRVCGKNARFVEMSKLNVWTPEEVQKLRPDIDYTIVDLTSVSRSTWSMLFDTLDGFLKKGSVKPIPYTRFDAVHIREALGYLQKARHIGKIVCIMPEVTWDKGQGHFAHKTPLFNAESTYLITGGLGGIGFEVCKWMCDSGARNIVLCNRNPPKEGHLEVIKQMRSRGHNILTKSVDCGDFQMMKGVIDHINDPGSKLPPLRGIMHAAGVLHDATLINQSWEKFQQCFRPKIKGAWNLHDLTKSLNLNLEHFVMFSSMAALFGPPGQSNHASGNAYLDALAWHRESLGLPATSINWGQWGQVGVAAGREVRGVLPFSPQRGIAALEATLKSQRTQICVVDLEHSVLVKVHPQSKSYMQNLTSVSSAQDSSSMSVSIKSEKFWEDVDACQGDIPRSMEVIKGYCKILLRQILKFDDEEPIDDLGNFQDMGLDSLMMIELKNNLQTVLGSRMSVGAGALADCQNVQVLAERLVQQMNEDYEANEDVKGQTEKLSPEEMKSLIEEDSKLPESIKVTEGSSTSVSHAKVFLLTGVTGFLAPWILKELLKQKPDISKVYCLFRKSVSNPEEKLSKILKEHDIMNNSRMTVTMTTITGDIAHPRLGMEQELWESLSLEVDCVINCAVKSNHVESYGRSSLTRKVNVEGMIHILEFCFHRRSKLLFHSSSIVGMSTVDPADGCLSEDWPQEGELEGVTDLGYPVSKMICDRLVHQAVERGLPAKSFRFGGLIGDSMEGRFRYHNNHIMLRFLCYMKLGAMPDVPVPAFLLPVDIAARTSVRIFLEDEVGEGGQSSSGSIYNILHPTPALEQEFPVLAKEFGFQVDIVEYNEFVNKFASEGQDSLLYPFREIYENEDAYITLMAFPDAIRKWLEKPDEFFKVTKVTKIMPEYQGSLKPTWDYVRNDLNFARKMGLFEKFKLTN